MKLEHFCLIFLFFFLLILVLPNVVAEEYSFENAEELTPLIDWRDYSPATFEEAQVQNKPIFLLLTAPSWCYWCQVYESEDYLFNPAVVEYINKNTIPIYVDADQRQDLTRQYLEGGWPSTTVLTPGRERLYGFSGVRPVANMLENLQNAVNHVNSNQYVNREIAKYVSYPLVIPTQQDIQNIVENYPLTILNSFDLEYGGFGQGQKFPQGRSLYFALEQFQRTGNRAWLELVKKTLENQYTRVDELHTNYNLFDPIEGGFHRYGTQRDWSPPHFEKMLYDNARLLKAYFLLNEIDRTTVSSDVVEKTHGYMIREWYDSKGGFYGNSDVNGEEEYYAQNPRALEKARVEPTKYTNWNAEAIITYTYLYMLTQDEQYGRMAKESLKFYQSMVTKNGAYHYEKDGERAVRGSLLDNSYLLLAFIEGYEVFQDEEILKSAKQLAEYSLDNLYDWNSGGFFERNSPDIDLYAPGEHVLLSKPTEENGIIIYALLKMYLNTREEVYLNAAIKSFGNQIDKIPGLDRGYYFYKSADIIRQNDLLPVFLGIEVEEKENFWLNEFEASDDGVDKLSGSMFMLLFVAILAGLISFASPCSLPIIPAFVANSLRSTDQNIKLSTMSFFLGVSVFFTILGLSSSYLGQLLKSHLTIFSQLSGIALIIFGIYILNGKGFTGMQVKIKPTNYFTSFLFGMTMAISWTPCVGPILVAILLLASNSTSIFGGGLLLFVYSLGLALPLVILTFYVDKVPRDGKLWTFLRGKELHLSVFNKKFEIHSSTFIAGILFIVMGILIFSGKLTVFNQVIGTSKFQGIIYKLEDFLLNLLR